MERRRFGVFLLSGYPFKDSPRSKDLVDLVYNVSYDENGDASGGVAAFFLRGGGDMVSFAGWQE
jgi:hypothetical protein